MNQETILIVEAALAQHKRAIDECNSELNDLEQRRLQVQAKKEHSMEVYAKLKADLPEPEPEEAEEYCDTCGYGPI
jgi:DNA repair exonuclease SbcCD ATPase subunit